MVSDVDKLTFNQNFYGILNQYHSKSFDMNNLTDEGTYP